MQREIKFKIYDKNDTNAIIGPFDWNKLPNFLYPENFTLLQYTGLQDSKGNDIYEGDFLKCPWGFGQKDCYSIGFVVFQNGSFKLAKCEEDDIEMQRYGKYDCYGFNDTPTRIDFWENAEIIGNIFENPELLKQ